MDILEQPLTEQDKETILREVIDRFLIPKYRELGLEASGLFAQLTHARNESIWGPDYTQYMVQGRGPNANQDPAALRAWAVWAGKTFIAEWAQRKGVDIDPIAIAYKIARDGTTHYPEGTELLEVLASPECIAFINQRVADFTVVQVRLRLQRDIKKAFA